MSAQVETAIFDLLAKVAPGKSVSPEEVARAVDRGCLIELLRHLLEPGEEDHHRRPELPDREEDHHRKNESGNTYPAADVEAEKAQGAVDGPVL